MTSSVACHHYLWPAQTVERHRAWHSIIAFGLAHIAGRRRAWHAIIALGRQTRSNDFGHGMPSTPFGSTHSRTMLSVASHHRPWTARTVGRRQVWHAIIVLGQQTRSNDVGRGMPSSPLGSTHSRTASGMACNHRLWAAHRVERRRTGHAIITFWQNKWSNNVRRGMSPSLLD